jgi:hypothetical protein
MVIFGAHQKWNGSLVKPPTLAIPLLDRVQGAFPCEIEHEEYCHSIVADKGEHVDEFALAAEVPYGKGNFCITDGDCLFHEVDTYRKDG